MTDPSELSQINNDELARMYEQAKEALPMLREKADDFLQRLRQQHPGVFDNVTFDLAELKDLEAARQKIEVRYGGDVSQITDLLRGRFVVENAEQLELIEEALKNDPEFSNIMNRFEQPVNNTGYRNMSSEARMPNGHVAEVLVVHQDMMVVDQYMHAQMDRVRELRFEAQQEGRALTSAEKKEIRTIEKDMREVSRAAAHDAADPKLNDLVDPDIRSRHVYTGEQRNGSALEAVLEKIEARQANTLTSPSSLEATRELRQGIEARNAGDASPTMRPTEPGEVVADAPTDGRASGGGALDNTAAHGDDAIDLARRSGDIADAMKGARAGKLTKLGIVTGVALTAGIAGLLHYAFGEQRELAEDLKDSGRISPEVYEEYIELNERIEAEMQAENLAGQGWLFLATTPAVELSARAQFEEFSRKHNLPEDVHQALGMSMFDGQSLRGEFAQGAADLIPQNMSDFPPELHGLWRAKQEMDDAHKAYDAAERYGTGRTRDSTEREARQEVRAEKMQDASRELSGAQAAYQQEFARAFSNPETAEYLMSRMDPDTLLEMVTETAQHNAEGKHPLIQEMARMQAQIEAGDEGFIFDSDSENRLEEIQDELKANPQIMYDYIAEVFGGRVEPNSIPQAEHAINQPVQEGFTAMPEFMQNRMIETAARSVDLKGDMEGVHPYLKDLAELYEAREGGTSRNQASTRARANSRIEEIEQEIRNHPEIIGEFSAQNPELQNIVSDYQNNKAEMDLQAEIPDARMDSVLLHIKQSAENNGKDSFSGENPLVQRLAELHDRRDGEFRGRGGTITKTNIDAEIRQIQNELRDNPDVLSEYGGRKMGDDLIPDGLQQEQGNTPDGPSTGGRRASITPDDVIDRTSEVGMILPPDATLIVQSSDGNASVARGALPDNQIRLMQGAGDQEPATLTEVEQQRVLQAQQEQQRLDDLAARQAEQQQYLDGRTASGP